MHERESPGVRRQCARTARELTNQDVEQRRQQQPEKSDAQHSREHRNSHGVAHLGARTGRGDERYHTHDESERGHQDRPQPETGRIQRGLQRRHALEFPVPRKLDDQDGVLARKPNEDDQADLREDVAVAVRELNAGNRRQQHHRHDENHRKRQTEALVLRSEHQEHQQHDEREYEHGGVSGDDLLVGQFRPLEAHAVGQLLAREPFHGRLRLARAEARARTAVDLGGGIGVVVHHAVGTRGVLDAHEGAERNHLARGIASLQSDDIFGLQTETRFGLGGDRVGAAEGVEIVDIQRTQVHLHGVEELLHGHALRFGFFAIDLGIDLRNVHLVAGK